MRQTRKWLARARVAGAAALLAIRVGFAGWHAKRALRISAEEVRSERETRFDTRPFAPPAEASFELVSAPAVFRQAALFQNHLYIGGPGGPLGYVLRGTSPPQFITGRDLPPSPPATPAPALLASSPEPEPRAGTTAEAPPAFN